MSPEDPRHGTYAGALAHRRSGVPACLPCQLAARRTVKAAKMRLDKGIRNRIPLGQRAYDILTNVGPTPVAEATGLWRNNLYRAQRRGPDALVLRTTRDAILAVSGPTPVGVQRRLQALAAVGHTMDAIAQAAGVHFERLARISRAAEPPARVTPRVARAVAAAYEQLQATAPAPGRETTRRRTLSEQRGWLPPHVWDDIDDGTEDPLAEIADDYVDEAVVLRLIAGDRVPSTRAEKVEAMRRWLDAGNAQAALCNVHGWQHGRYVDRQDGAA